MAKSSSPSSPKRKAAKASNKTIAKTKLTSSNISAGSKKDQMYRYICEQHVMGITQVSKMDVALAVGNTNTRSEGFAKPLKALDKDDGLITAGTEKDSVVLTEKGIQGIPKDLQVSNDPSKTHERYIKFIESKAKFGADKVSQVWEVLMDRKPHRINDIATKLGYNNPRSFANTKIVQVMKDAGLVEDVGKGAIQFTKKVPAVSNV